MFAKPVQLQLIMGSFQIAVSVLCCFVAFTNAAWTTERPLDSAVSPGVTFVGSTVALTRILLDENLSHNMVIAKVNFDDEGGTLGPPEITGFDDGKNNSALGVRTEKQGADWFLVVEFPQDYERPEQRQYGFYFDTGAPGRGHRVLLVTRNLNDNLPDIISLELECVIAENTAVTIDSTPCTFFVIDHDGDIGHVTFFVRDNPVRAFTKFFSLDFLRIIDENSAIVGLLVASPGLDFEANSSHVLEIQAFDGRFTSIMTRKVQVVDLPDTPHRPSRAVRAHWSLYSPVDPSN